MKHLLTRVLAALLQLPPTGVGAVPSGVGPQAMMCPAGAVMIAPGTHIQTVVNANVGGSTFCLRAGVHPLTAGIAPKTGNTFVGEYGAILDGTGWTTTDVNQGAFRSHNQNIDDVTIRNLVIRNMPQRGIHAFKDSSDRWTIEYNEIAFNVTGMSLPHAATVRFNYLHHNLGNPASSVYSERGGGYGSYQANDILFEGNEIAYNGPEQKVSHSNNTIFRNNFVHHNLFSGIWYDGDNTNSLIEGNTIEDHPQEGIFYEISGSAIIRNNTIRRSGNSGMFIAGSKDVDIYNNILEDNLRAVQYFLSCARVGGGSIDRDLTNNRTRNNVITVGTRSGALAVTLLSTTCTAAQTATYLDGSKNLIYEANHYIVPSLTTRYWIWGSGSGGQKTWAQWQALGHDVGGTVTIQ